MIPSGSSGLMGTKSKWVKKKMGVEESDSEFRRLLHGI